jgi:hypothetical protein
LKAKQTTPENPEVNGLKRFENDFPGDKAVSIDMELLDIKEK